MKLIEPLAGLQITASNPFFQAALFAGSFLVARDDDDESEEQRFAFLLFRWGNCLAVWCSIIELWANRGRTDTNATQADTRRVMLGRLLVSLRQIGYLVITINAFYSFFESPDC